MIQLRVGGPNQFGVFVYDTYLDLYDEDLPKLNLSIEDIRTTDTTTTFSRQFRLPNTSNNAQFFTTLFNVNGRDFDITAKQPAILAIDGTDYKIGEIRLQNIYINAVDSTTEYEVIFLGDVRNFATSLGESVLCQLDFSEFSHLATLANVTASWDAYPETPSTQDEGLFSGSIVYPLVDFGNDYDDDNDLASGETRIQNGGSETNFTQGTLSANLDAARLRPCIKAKDVFDKIFSNAGFTYTSQFLDSNLFRHLYVGAWGDEAQTSLEALTIATPTETYEWDDTAEFTIPWDNQLVGTGWDVANDRYVIPSDASYDLQLQLSINTNWVVESGVETNGSVDYVVRIKKISSGVTTTLSTLTTTVNSVSDIPNTTSLISPFINNVALLANDYIFATIEVQNPDSWNESYFNYWNTRFSITTDVAANPGVALSCNFKQIDFIKAIITKFRLVLAPSKSDPTNFIIEPWAEYVATGDLFNWTEKLDESKDFVIKPVFYTQANRIEFTDEKGDDYLNVINQEDLGEVYGRLLFDANNELLKGERKIETKFTPLPSTQIERAVEANNGMDNTIIPQIVDHEVAVNSSNDTIIKFNPVKPGVRLFWYDGMKHTGTTSARDNNWYLKADAIGGGTDAQAFTKFPMISQFNEWGDRDDSWTGIDTLTQDLNWQREVGWIKFGLQNPLIGGSVYDYYWASYINTLYDKWSRRVTAYFILDSNDLLDFSFDDVIFVKDAYYYVERIYDVIIGEKSSVKVDLIKLNDYFPDTSGFIPPGEMWEDIVTNWESVTDNWEDV